MKYPYFRGLEADRYSFYRVPKALIKVDLFEKMSGDAKLLYAVLLDRMNLSLKNGWQDENGNAYIICTIDEIMDSIRCARQKAVKLLDECLAQRIAILDGDVHYGNGTDDIIERLGLQDRIIHNSMGKHFETREQAGPDGSRFEAWLGEALKQSARADLVLYQAGADPHIDDPLGGVLTESEMLGRDIAVFRACRRKALVWNLAGGYQRDANGSIEPVLKLHRNTLVAYRSVSTHQS